MADGQTTNFHWTLPENHVNTNQWGGQNNANWQDADTKVYANQQNVNAILGQTSTATVSNVQVARTASQSATVAFTNSAAPAGQQLRWLWGENTTAEAAGNVGSDIALNAYSNTGAYLRTNIFVQRSSGAVTFAGTASFSSTLTCAGAASFSSTLTCAGTASFSSTLTCAGAASFSSTLSCGSTINGATLVSNQGAVIIAAGTVSSNPTVTMLDSGGTARANFFYSPSTDQVVMKGQVTGAALVLDGVLNFTYNGSGNAYKAGGGSWQASSDARIKNAVGDYTPGLAEVIQLRPVNYTYKGNDQTDLESDSLHKHVAEIGKPFVGLIAQEVEAVFPSMVTQRAGYIDGEAVTDLRDVDTSELIYALINSVRQLKAEIEALKAVG